jgi:hypothetical protein
MTTENEQAEARAELATDERLDPARLRPAEHVFRIWSVTVPIGTPLARVLLPEFWSRCTDKFASPAIDQPPDWIICTPPDRSWIAWLVVMSIGAEGVQVAGMAAKELPHLSAGSQRRWPLGQNVEDFEFKDLGPGEGWCVVRHHDQHVMHNCTRQSQCAPWLTGYLRTVRS